ncbi:hypothetical protein N800_03890 [Lysobacter daejeonensis GH1-9]|uniref:Uncharacterized protein n=1 Tax=Lysobacter daejeonensis GH1-9 TaxID=1385517 RepID=A0A0A0EST0_9GAMM|nr:hypothetical protein [Lysobacter daejeonensis]KGM53574.1 hypothetical protein N800_03890 [Lysobacter daejeonensis GH1-9]
MSQAVNGELLRKVATAGEMDGQELIGHVTRKSGTYADFYGLAAMIQSGFIATNTEPGMPFGRTTRESAALLYQLGLKPGESFLYGEVPWEAWGAGPVTFFITGAGVLKVEELDSKRSAKRQKRMDYFVSAIVAILAAALSSTATHLYAQYRETSGKQGSPIAQPSPNNSFNGKPLCGSP